ncbi:hypothetical protein PVAP13_5NG347381, partial [Panicum virgatum]
GGRVNTDKGFKDVHLNKVARDLSEFTGQEVSGSQMYNHLRKWRSRWDQPKDAEFQNVHLANYAQINLCQPAKFSCQQYDMRSNEPLVVKQTIHAERGPRIVKAVLGCRNFTKTHLIFCLDHLMECKRFELGFLDMNDKENDLSLTNHLTMHDLLY